MSKGATKAAPTSLISFFTSIGADRVEKKNSRSPEGFFEVFWKFFSRVFFFTFEKIFFVNLLTFIGGRAIEEKRKVEKKLSFL